MLITAILLTISGFLIMQWSINAMSQTFKPLIFYKPGAVILIYLLWLGLLIGGLYCFWQVNYLIVMILVGIFLLLTVNGLYLGSEKMKAKKICKIYKQLKLYQPFADELEILKTTANIYFQNLHWDKNKIDLVLESIFERDVILKDRDIKNLISSIFIWEDSSSEVLRSDFNFEKYNRKGEKRDKVIEKAYNSVFAEIKAIKERPSLSKSAIESLKKQGLDSDEMSNEQLAALESLDNIEKYHWFPKLITWSAGGAALNAIISIFYLDFLIVGISAGVSLLLFYIAYRIQIYFSAKKFQQASIQNFIADQKTKHAT